MYEMRTAMYEAFGGEDFVHYLFISYILSFDMSEAGIICYLCLR